MGGWREALTVTKLMSYAWVHAEVVWRGMGTGGDESNNITDDFGAPLARSATLGIATDLGSDEFTTSQTPFPASVTGTIAYGDSTTYTLNGRIIGRIYWGNGGSLPGSVALRYYSGDDPPNVSSGNYGNAYWLATPSGGSGYRYKMRLFFTPAVMGTIPDLSRVRLAARYGSNPWIHHPFSTCDPSEYWVEQDSLSSLYQFALSDNNAPLPVELVAFTARMNAGSVELRWKTASEINAFRYYVERRTEGGWSDVGFVDARGSVDTPSEYMFVDRTPAASAEYVYRLRMTDRDGTYEHSNEVRLITGYSGGFTAFPNYPNPFASQTTISFYMPEQDIVTVDVLDPSGRQVERLHNGFLPSGMHTFTFFARSLQSGLYFTLIRTSGGIRSGTLLLAR